MTDRAYQSRIQALGWAELRVLWEQIMVGDTPDWEAGKAFEYLVGRAFELGGAAVTYPFSVRDGDGLELEQIDGVVYHGAITCLVECKDWTTPAGYEPIAKMREMLARRPQFVIGSVFTTSYFTLNSVQNLNRHSPQNILLWERADVDFCLKTEAMCEGMTQKLRKLIEQGAPNFYLKQV